MQRTFSTAKVRPIVKGTLTSIILIVCLKLIFS